VDIRRFPHSLHNPDVEGDALSNWVPEAGIGSCDEPRPVSGWARERVPRSCPASVSRVSCCGSGWLTL
jgi:hypothetical protein